MKVSIIKTFVDKNTGLQVFPGAIIECADDRGKLLAENGFAVIADVEKVEPVVPVEEKAVARPKPAAKKAPAKATTKKKESK